MKRSAHNSRRQTGFPAAARNVLAAVLMAASAGCSSNSAPGGGPPPPADNRVLGIAANPREVPPPVPQDYLDAAALVRGAGVRGTIQTDTWSVLEPAPGQYALQDLQNGLNFAASQGLQAYVGIQVINTVPKTVPSDLMGVNWNDPQMESRFHALLDAILPLLGNQVTYLSIGNEVDVYLTAHPAEWTSYEGFYEDALAYIHQKSPGIRVGVTTTFTGASGAARANVALLNSRSDLWIFTYYPLGAGFVPNSPQSPLTDFPTMLTLAGTKDVALQEVGYPSSTAISSSEANQASFVTAFFQAWQNTGQRIPFLSFFLLHDLTPSICSQLNAYYGVPPDPAFQAYLCTLGLRHDDDTLKPAWAAFVNAAAANGFPH
ncbi:MAG TPA: hypothetical protein VJO53_09395 [Candidatus Acidoferrales bacterium]|nr:hypothetical protein [Candidatus Acidoferrales bacterium]